MPWAVCMANAARAGGAKSCAKPNQFGAAVTGAACLSGRVVKSNALACLMAVGSPAERTIMRGRRGSQGTRKKVPVSLSPSCFSTPAGGWGACRDGASDALPADGNRQTADAVGHATDSYPPFHDFHPTTGFTAYPSSVLTHNRLAAARGLQHRHHLAGDAPALQVHMAETAL